MMAEFDVFCHCLCAQAPTNMVTIVCEDFCQSRAPATTTENSEFHWGKGIKKKSDDRNQTSDDRRKNNDT